MKNLKETITRGDSFKMLAACFYEPDQALFLEERACENLGSLLKKRSPGAAKAARDMELGLKSNTQDQLNVDYASLFVGPFELLAAPYGSVYTEENRRVMGDLTMQTLRFYQDAGLMVDIKEPPDHIVIELEFMYYLCNKEANAASDSLLDEAGKYRDMQVQFFHEAMLPWIPQFCKSIRSGTVNPFYAALADCLSRFMVSCELVYGKEAQCAAA